MASWSKETRTPHIYATLRIKVNLENCSSKDMTKKLVCFDLDSKCGEEIPWKCVTMVFPYMDLENELKSPGPPRNPELRTLTYRGLGLRALGRIKGKIFLEVCTFNQSFPRFHKYNSICRTRAHNPSYKTSDHEQESGETVTAGLDLPKISDIWIIPNRF